MWIIGMALFIVFMRKLFKKAGKKGWEVLILIYNFIVLIVISRLPMWYIALFFVPFVNIYAMFKIYIEIAHKFGKSTGYGVAMVFFAFICILMLALGKSEYQGNNNNSINSNVNSYNNMQNSINFNQQANMSNNNLNSNIMNVNNSVNEYRINNANTQNNGNTFQPIGNVSNNVQNMNVNNIENINNLISDNLLPSIVGVNNQGIPTNNAQFNINLNNFNIVKKHVRIVEHN